MFNISWDEYGLFMSLLKDFVAPRSIKILGLFANDEGFEFWVLVGDVRFKMLSSSFLGCNDWIYLTIYIMSNAF